MPLTPSGDHGDTFGKMAELLSYTALSFETPTISIIKGVFDASFVYVNTPLGA